MLISSEHSTVLTFVHTCTHTPDRYVVRRQTASIRSCSRCCAGVLPDAIAPSLFCRWLSESGKLATKLLGRVDEPAEGRDTLVAARVDEAGPLASSRSSSRGGQPGDAVRAVHSVQLPA